MTRILIQVLDVTVEVTGASRLTPGDAQGTAPRLSLYPIVREFFVTPCTIEATVGDHEGEETAGIQMR